VGLRADSLVAEWAWPARQRQPPLASCYDRGRAGSIDRATSFRMPPQKIAKRNLQEAFAAMRAGGIADPTARHFIVDVEAGAGRSSFAYGYCPTITASRAASRGYWGTYVGRRLTITELMRLQGASPDRLVQNISDRPRASVCELSWRRDDRLLFLRLAPPPTTPSPRPAPARP
jgi:hypothetical protein